MKKNNTHILIMLTMLLNVFLAISKVVVGTLAHSIAIISDGINHANDFMNNLIGLITLKISQKPADKEHPYGHRRVEYIGSVIIGIIIAFSGLSLFFDSVKNIFNHANVDYDFLSIFVIVLSIVIKFIIWLVDGHFAKKNHSELLKAFSIDAVMDCFTSSGIVVAIIINKAFGINLDGIIGAIISLYMIYSSFQIISDQVNFLIGPGPDQDLTKKIKDFFATQPEIISYHDLMIHNYGYGEEFASVHVCMDGSKDIFYLHNIVDEIEKQFYKEFNIKLTIHIDPVDLNSKELQNVNHELEIMIKNNKNLKGFHDVRIEKCQTHNTLYLDVEVPYGCDIDTNQIINQINEILNNRYEIYLEIDRV